MTLSKIANTLPRKDRVKTGLTVSRRCSREMSREQGTNHDLQRLPTLSELKRGVARIVCLNERGGRRYQ